MDDFITFLRCNIGNIIALCGVFGIGLEIAPVNIRPISWILKKAGNVINEDLIKKVNILDKEFKEFKDDEYMERINSIRKEIVDFSLSCQRKERHGMNLIEFSNEWICTIIYLINMAWKTGKLI